MAKKRVLDTLVVLTVKLAVQDPAEFRKFMEVVDAWASEQKRGVGKISTK